jgi:hypothetical protein
MPEDDFAVRWRCLFNSPFMHPAVMLRGETLRKNELLYDENFVVAQDYELWSRLLSHGKGANLRERLYIRRDRQDSISRRRGSEQHKFRDVVSKAMLERQFPDRKIDIWVIGRLRDSFVNRTADAPGASKSEIEEYAALLDDFAKGTGAVSFQRRELLAQGGYFLKKGRLDAAFSFFREIHRAGVLNISRVDIGDALNFGGIKQ